MRTIYLINIIVGILYLVIFFTLKPFWSNLVTIHVASFMLLSYIIDTKNDI